MQPDQLDLLTTLSAPTLHPSGDRAVVAATRPDQTTNSYVGQLWEVPVTGGRPRRISRGFRDTAPRFSPDGERLAFLRADGPTGRPQLHVGPGDGGEAVRLTDAPLGVAGFAWAPEGGRIAYTARVPEPGRYGTDPDVPADQEPPRLITDLRYLSDGVGYVGDRRHQVFVVDIPDLDASPAAPSGDLPISRQVTEGPSDSVEVVWRPDGGRLAFVSARHDGRADDLVTDAWTCDPDGGDRRRVTGNGLTVDKIAFSPDGATLWLLASDPGPSRLEFIARHTGLWSVPADGSGAATRHTDAETVDLGEVGSMLTVTADGVLVQNRTRGAVELLRVRADDSVDRVITGPRIVTGHDGAGAGDEAQVVAVVKDASSPGELVVVTGDGEQIRTDFAAPLRAVGVAGLLERTVTADDGYPVHGWVVLPEGPGPHPVLLDIHGGPFTQYGWDVYDEAQVLARAGYAVLLANPRGSAGYGQQHGRSVTGALGQRDAADLLDFLDGVLDDPTLGLERERLGVLGGSYGGYMTAWLTGHPRAAGRFAAAVVERGFLEPVSFAGTSDIGWYFGDQLVGTDPGTVAAQSPMAAVDRVVTPTLVIHSEQDYRCPLEQSQRYFHALQKRGVPSELLIFPGESHGLTRDGRPRHRRQRFDHLLRWWGRHLPTEPNGLRCGGIAGTPGAERP